MSGAGLRCRATPPRPRLPISTSSPSGKMPTPTSPSSSKPKASMRGCSVIRLAAFGPTVESTSGAAIEGTACAGLRSAN